MNSKFHGSLQELLQLLSSIGISGNVEDQPNGVFLIRCADHVQILWSSTKGTIWLTGRGPARTERAAAIEQSLSRGAAMACALIPEKGERTPERACDHSSLRLEMGDLDEDEFDFDDELDDEDIDFGLDPNDFDDD